VASFLVLGAGAVGTATARALASRGQTVTVIEKEPAAALHQSGRNSGVLHAGYNLKPGSTKARFCRAGNRELRAYCEARGVALRQDGILVVAQRDDQRDVLAELERRAHGNDVDARLLDGEAAIRAIEPHATGVAALQAREGGSFDARAYVHALQSDAMCDGASFLYDTRALRIDENRIVTDKGTLEADVVVNAAGLFADKMAGPLCPDMRIIPFRGYYAELAPHKRDLVRSHLYAAPDLAFPFLGVHLSRRADGRVIVGPGAMLALGKEAYHLLGFQGGGLGRTLGYRGFYKMMVKPEFRRLVRSEVVKSLSLGAIAREAAALVPGLTGADLRPSFAGNRAQMVDRDGALVDDIVVRTSAQAVHVLNAVSPGLTCSLPFGAHLADLAEKLA